MLFEFTGICQHCAEDVKVFIHNGKALDVCANCREDPFGFKKLAGLIYIVSNPNQIGVKIGFTSKSIEQRLKTLNTTGVAGKFEPIAIFPSNFPRKDEKKVHEKLKRYKLEKEHFNIDPVEATLAAYRALLHRACIIALKISINYLNIGGRFNETIRI